VVTTNYFTGLDLGQTTDYSALAVLEQTRAPAYDDPGRMVKQYAVRHLQRFPLGTPYTAICAQVGELFATNPLLRTTLVVDQTGVGRPVVDMLRKASVAAQIRPITITGGQQASPAADGWHVPKKELVSTLQVLLQTRRLQVAPSLPEAKTLVKELLDFKVKITAAAHETFGNFREGTHDDLVLAIMLAAWQGSICGSCGFGAE
jgi:hypothetical protein